jgi:glycosyltransferase involved in cell wall biosynthesis
MVGAFDDPRYEMSLGQRIAAYDLEQAVVRTGQVPYTDVPNWLACANVGLIALQRAAHFMTSVPTKLFEYMISGLPVVASDLPPARQFMEGLDCGFLVDPARPEEYARAMAYLLTHPAEAKTMGRNGRRAVEERYNWSAEAPRLVQLYRQLASA